MNYGVANQPGSVRLSVTSLDRGEVLVAKDLPVAAIAEWQWVSVPLAKPYAYTAGEKLQVTYEAVDFTKDNALSIVLAKWDHWDAFQKLYLWFGAILLFLITFCYIGLYRRPVRIELLFAVTLTCMMCMFTILIPAGHGADEGAHTNLAYSIAEKLMGWESSVPENVAVSMEESKYAVNVDAPDHAAYVSYLKDLSSKETEEGIGEIERFGSLENPMITYFPAALGIAAGRSLHLSAPAILTFGRVLSFLVILLILLYAIWRIPIGKEILFTMCLLPVMIQQVTTINVDGIDIALAVALCAACLRIICNEKGRIRFLDYGVAVVSALMLSRCKFGALIPACLVLLIVFFRKRKNTDREGRIVAWSALGLLLVCVAAGFVPLLMRSQDVYGATLWSDHYSIREVFSDIPGTIRIFLNTFFYQGDMYLLGIGGVYLSWQNIILPQYIVIVLLLLTLFSCVAEAGEKPALNRGERVLFIVLSILGVLCAMGGMLIGWTDRGADQISGVQGRYFLPFLLPFLLGSRTSRVRLDPNGSYRKNLLMAAVFTQVLVITALFVRA